MYDCNLTASKPFSSYGKASACNAGDLGPIPGSGIFPGEGNSNPLQYSCLENPMDGGAWGATIPWGRKGSDTTEQLHSLIITKVIKTKSKVKEKDPPWS